MNIGQSCETEQESLGPKRESFQDRVYRRKSQLETELVQINELVAQFEKNPEGVKLLEYVANLRYM